MRAAVALLLLFPAVSRSGEQSFGGDFGPVRSDIFIPDVKVVRGVIVHAMNAQFKTDDRWADLGRELGFAHVVMSIDRKANNRPTKLTAALAESLKEFAAKSGHPELVHAPRVGTGHSAGGMVTDVLIRDPALTLTTCVDCSWVLDPAKLDAEGKKVPLLFTMGAIPDAFKMLPAIEQFYVPARKDSLAWGLGLQHGCAHDWGNAAALQVPWMKAIVAIRLDPAADPTKGPVKLKPVVLEDGWLGDREATNGTYATIASWADYKGDRATAAWLPDRTTAEVWRAWQSKNSPITLEAATADGSAKLIPFDPKKSRDLKVPAATAVKLSVSVKPGITVKKVAYFAGEKLIGEATAAPWEFTWDKPLIGCHVVYARWTNTDDQPGVSNPSLFLVRAK
ncbi:MAG: hypothetical protein C0467_03900 [Planctomycetaceae bacterium]|nr:hypothetical protein [Planctomycetaceae bacterium]